MQKNFSKINIKFLKNLTLFAGNNGKFSIIGGVYTIPPTFVAAVCMQMKQLTNRCHCHSKNMILDFSDAVDKFDVYEYVKTLHPKDILSPSFIRTNVEIIN
jgi:hypothetical protein